MMGRSPASGSNRCQRSGVIGRDPTPRLGVRVSNDGAAVLRQRPPCTTELMRCLAWETGISDRCPAP